MALAWLCSLPLAAFGLFMGYLVPSENVMQLIGPALALLAFAGGLFVPVSQLGETFATIAQYTPVYGASVLTRWPIVSGDSQWSAVFNVLVWTMVFVAGAIWCFRRDTARV